MDIIFVLLVRDSARNKKSSLSFFIFIVLSKNSFITNFTGNASINKTINIDEKKENKVNIS